MTGMKEGAGEDPFAEDDAPAMTGGSSSPAEAELSDESETRASTDDASASGGERAQQSTSARFRIPYKFRRDGVQDGRDRVPLFLHEETKRAERDALHELEDRFDDDVSLTDLREALVMAGLDHLDEVEGQLEEWGYGMTFDE
jgi:hypothetical protein